MLNSSYGDDGNNGQMITHSQGDFSLLEVIDRILDKGLVVNGDITLAIAGTDFLSLKINLVIASLETAKRYGIQLPWEKWEEEKRATESQVGATPNNLPYENVPMYEENNNSEPMADQQQDGFPAQYQTNNETLTPRQQAPAQATRRRKRRSAQRR